MIVNDRLQEAAFKQSPNVGGKLKKPRFIVVHYTAGRNAAASVNWLCQKIAKASAHLVIGREGSVYQLAPFNQVCWHAGQSSWAGYSGLNSHSIGIELDNCGPLVRSNGKWRSLHLGTTYENSDVVELSHKHGGPVRGWLLYSDAQLKLLEQICLELAETYPTLTDVIGHDDCAPNRKIDPGPQLDLEALRSKVFGRG